MSPEQFSSPQDVGPAADTFCLGAVVAYAATGHGPFDSPSPYRDGPKSRPTPDELLGLLRDGRIPEPRPPEPTKADKETSPVRPPRRRRHLWSAIALGAALLAAVTATTVAVTDDDSAPADLPACRPAGRQAGRPGTRSRRTRASTRSRSAPAVPSTALSPQARRWCARATRSWRPGLPWPTAATWARPVDATPDDIGSSSSNGGTIIGAHADRVYVYGSDDRSLADGMTTPTRYTIRAIRCACSAAPPERDTWSARSSPATTSPARA
ncbi:hypothetical protein [Streptomyces sp. NPDC056468]|uniref:hypothetical protein n=1 Tax=Streptomyces sp. NPDC056468 TaxID=3345830 RepID=UPI0036C378C9